MRAWHLAFKPSAPKATGIPRVSGRTRRFPCLRPVCHFRNFAFFGANIKKLLLLFFRLFVEYIAAVYPHFDANDAVWQVRLFARKINVGAQSLQGHAAALDLLGARHFCASEPTRDGDTDALHIAIGHHLFYGLFQDATERLPFLQAFSDHVCDDGRLGFGRAHLLNVEAHRKTPRVRHLHDDALYLFRELCRALAAATNNESWTRGFDEHANGLLRALYLDGGDVVPAQALLEKAADGGIYHHVLAVLRGRLREPARLPVADDAEAVCIRMNGVGHIILRLFSWSSLRAAL